MPNESSIKRSMVKRIKEEGGYGRRLEDSYAVGIPDLILVPKYGFVFITEVKIIKGEAKFGCTARQAEELKRIGDTKGFAIPLLIGYGQITGRLYACQPKEETYAKDAICSVPRPWDISDLLNTYAEMTYYRQSLIDAGKLTETLPITPG